MYINVQIITDIFTDIYPISSYHNLGYSITPLPCLPEGKFIGSYFQQARGCEVPESCDADVCFGLFALQSGCHVSNEKMVPGCFRYIGDEILPT